MFPETGDSACDVIKTGRPESGLPFLLCPYLCGQQGVLNEN
jgi:hypothetical protein